MNPVKFVVYGVPRVGSNFFISQLNCHPDILCHYEIFHRHAIHDGFVDKPESCHWLEAVSLQERDASPESFLARLFENHHGYTHVGYNLFPNQNDSVLKRGFAESSLKKIILKRKNILENYISFKVAVKTGVWSSKAAKERGVDETRLDKRVHFEKKEFINHVRRINRFYDNVENNIALKQGEALVIYYEDMLRDRQAVLCQVYDFLGVERVILPGTTIFKKQNREDLRELVYNYGELEVFLGERYHDFSASSSKKVFQLSRAKGYGVQNDVSAKNKKKLNGVMLQRGIHEQMVKIDIHIGMEKTGTSSIQAALMQAKNDLSEAGILFPVSFNAPNNTYLATAFLSDNKVDILRIVNDVAGDEQLADFRFRLMRDFEEELCGANYHRVVVSSEHLSSRLLTAEEIKRLKHFFEPYSSDVSIYLYLRPQDEVCISHYSTAVKFVDVVEPFVFPPLETVRQDFFYDSLVALWASVFGREHLHIRSYERISLEEGDVVVDFWRWLQLPENIRPSVKKLNLSLDVKKLAFLRYFNIYVPRFVNGRLNQMRGDIAAAMDLVESMGRKMDVSEEERAKFMVLFDEGNRKVATEYFGREWLFTPRTANMRSLEKTVEMEDVLTADDAVKITADLWRILEAKNVKKERQLADLKAKNQRQLADLKAKNQRLKERNDSLISSIDAVALYSIFKYPFKKWRAYRTLMGSYRHGRLERQ